MKIKTSVEAIIQREKERGHFTDAYVSCGDLDSGEILYSQGWYQAEGTVFDLASLTKALVTGPLVFEFIRDRSLALDMALEEWGKMPHFASSLAQKTARELLGHYAGLPAWWNFWMPHLNEQTCDVQLADRLRRIELVLSRIPVGPSGSELYSDVGYITLGYVLEALCGRDLESLWSSWKMVLEIDAEQWPIAFRSGLCSLAPRDFVATARCELRSRVLQGEVHDENCAAMGGIAGHAGLFATGQALDKYLIALASHPLGKAYLEANYCASQETSREGLLGLRRGIVASALPFGNGAAMGHLGFTGTAFWIDWERKVFATFLSNRVCSGRLPTRMGEVRSQIFGLLNEAVR